MNGGPTKYGANSQNVKLTSGQMPSHVTNAIRCRGGGSCPDGRSNQASPSQFVATAAGGQSVNAPDERSPFRCGVPGVR